MYSTLSEKVADSEKRGTMNPRPSLPSRMHRSFERGLVRFRPIHAHSPTHNDVGVSEEQYTPVLAQDEVG